MRRARGTFQEFTKYDARQMGREILLLLIDSRWRYRGRLWGSRTACYHVWEKHICSTDGGRLETSVREIQLYGTFQRKYLILNDFDQIYTLNKQIPNRDKK